MKPKLIKGGSHSDNRGSIIFNNDFDVSEIKRIYTIQNKNTNFVRAWQGHAIEKRWFSAIKGSFLIKLIKIDNWENPKKNLEVYSTILNDKNFDTLKANKEMTGSNFSKIINDTKNSGTIASNVLEGNS